MLIRYPGRSPIGNEEHVKTARRYLAASLARDRERDLWWRVETDEDLGDDVRVGIGTLKPRLESLLANQPALPEAPGPQFWPRIDGVLEEVG